MSRSSALAHIGHFDHGEADLVFLGPGGRRTAFQSQRVIGGGCTSRPAVWRISAASRGNNTRNTNGTEANTPKPAANTALPTMLRLPTCTWCEAVPKARRVLRDAGCLLPADRPRPRRPSVAA